MTYASYFKSSSSHSQKRWQSWHTKFENHFQARPLENHPQTVRSSGVSMCIANVHQIHPTRKHGLKTADFFRKCAQFVDSLATGSRYPLILESSMFIGIPNKTQTHVCLKYSDQPDSFSMSGIALSEMIMSLIL